MTGQIWKDPSKLRLANSSEPYPLITGQITGLYSTLTSGTHIAAKSNLNTDQN